MRSIALALFAFTLSLMTIHTADAASKAPAKNPAEGAVYPGVMALSQEPNGKWIYKMFPDLVRLYVYDKDAPGKSNCDPGCISAWPPAMPTAEDRAIGAWTIITREGGVQQWAYKGKPVYARFHDITDDLTNGAVDGFHLLEP